MTSGLTLSTPRERPSPAVLHLVLSFRRGGRKNAILSLARGLKDQAVRCDLCCLDELGCDPAEVDGLFAEVTVLGRGRTNYLDLARRLRLLCRRRRIGVIHTHDAASQFLAVLVRLACPRVRVIMTFHRSLGFESARRRDRLRNAAAGWLTAAVVTGSAERRGHYLAENRIAPRKVGVIPFGTDPGVYRPDPAARAVIRASLGITERTVVVGAVGHYGPEKGVDLVVRGFTEYCQRHPDGDAVLVVLGDGPSGDRERMLGLAAALPPSRVILAGFRPRPEEWYAAFDVFAHAPRLEAFGLAVIEAMATRLPVLATRVGGVAEIVRDGETGLLVPAESVDGLAGGLARLVRDPVMRAGLATRGYEVALGLYTARLYAERYQDLYRRVLDGHPPVTP